MTLADMYIFAHQLSEHKYTFVAVKDKMAVHAESQKVSPRWMQLKGSVCFPS
jgi:hypothetical protein